MDQPIPPEINQFSQGVGAPVPGWTARPLPPCSEMAGRFCSVEPLNPARHADELFAAFAEDRDGRLWTYYSYGPFGAPADYRAWCETFGADKGRLFHAIRDLGSGRAAGVAAYINAQPTIGVIEVGSLVFSPLLQRRPAATEAMYLMMRRAFDELGYRRYEWKCDSLNAPSRAAALRYGFQYEGLFRQATITRGRNRDTAWFSVIDRDWPVARAGFERWLDPDNFAADGTQRRSLAQCRAG